MKKILIISFITLTATFPIYAQSGGGSNTNNPINNRLPTYTLLEPLPCIPNATPAADDPCTKAGTVQTQLNFKYYVQYIFNLLIALAAVASVFMIVYGGFQYMSTDSWQGKSDGLSKVKNALLGLLLVLTSFIILRTIDPRLVAIPTTLVPPLNIKYESVGPGLLSQLKKEADSFNTNVIETKAKLVEAEKRNEQRFVEVQKLDEEIEAFEARGLTENDPEIKAAEAKIDALTNEMERELVNGKLLLARENFNVVLYKFTPSVGVVTSPDFNWGNAAQEVDRVYIQQNYALKELGAEPDQIQELVRYRDYSLAVIAINTEVAKVVQIRRDFDNIVDGMKFVQTKIATNNRLQAESEKTTTKIMTEIASKPIFSTTDPVIKKMLFDKIRESNTLMAGLKIE
jgi:hypothetical protein